MRSSLLLAVLAFLAVSLGTPEAARAAKRATTTQAVEKAAKKACITGDFRKGVDLLGDLFVETNDFAYVYNQGRCFEQNHRWEEAIDRFREYLRKASNVSATDKTDTENHISECEARLAKLAPPPMVPIAAPASPPPVPPAPAPPPTPPPAPPAAPVNLAASPAVDEHHPSSRLRTAGIVTVAVGLAALGGGLSFNLQANSLNKELNDMNTRNTWDQNKASRRDSYWTLAWIGYGVGAAALVTGTTLIIVGWPSGAAVQARPAVALTPALLPGIAVLSLRGTY